MIRRLGPAMLAEGHWYRKVAFAFLRPAVPGEEIRTMVDGNEETKKIAQAGDYVVRADTKYKELYVLPQQKASDAYDLAAPMDIAERLDAAELRAGGFRCYRCRTRIKAIRASESLLSKICPQKRFMASWGSPCVVKADDMLAAQVSDSTIKEIYRIEKTVFKETFSLDQ
ncbi:unnamed protein product [Effrenium voratum]|nr:unnamed protein product [Effrenium voratum]